MDKITEQQVAILQKAIQDAIASLRFFREKQSIIDIKPPIVLEGYQYDRHNIDEMNKVFYPLKFEFQPDGSCDVYKADIKDPVKIIETDYVVRDMYGKVLFFHAPEFEKRFEEIKL